MKFFFGQQRPRIRKKRVPPPPLVFFWKFGKVLCISIWRGLACFASFFFFFSLLARLCLALLPLPFLFFSLLEENTPTPVPIYSNSNSKRKRKRKQVPLKKKRVTLLSLFCVLRLLYIASCSLCWFLVLLLPYGTWFWFCIRFPA